jgi:hypothetical protein
VPELARERARAADERLRRGGPAGPLDGLPVAHKDLVLTAGIRTTMGSPIYADWVPEESSLIYERIQAAGGVTVGKIVGSVRDDADPRATEAVAGEVVGVPRAQGDDCAEARCERRG